MKHKQNGFAHILILLASVLAIVGTAGWLVHKRSNNQQQQDSNLDVNTTSAAEEKTTEETEEQPKEPDSADTLSAPEKITSADAKTYFVYGAPIGQNNRETKRIIVSLPGHGTTADDGYEAWENHLSSLNGGTYALAEFNWWDGEGEKKEDYYSPVAVVEQVRSFLKQQEYDSDDIVVLHGFSRGSANTYAVIAQDRLKSGSEFDAVISNAGKYQTDFPLASPELSDQQIAKVFKGIPWVLACGGLDDNPERDGCPGMEETKVFLEAHEANVLGIVTDPNKGHGAFHVSDLQLPKQAIDLIESAL